MEDNSKHQSAEFSKVKNGYSVPEVDAEIDRLCGRIEMLQNENERLDSPSARLIQTACRI